MSAHQLVAGDWKERLYAAMDAEFKLYGSTVRDTDSQRLGMRNDDTQIGVEFAMKWFEKNIPAALAATQPAAASESVDTPEFRKIAWHFNEQDAGTSDANSAFEELIAHIHAWGWGRYIRGYDKRKAEDKPAAPAAGQVAQIAAGGSTALPDLRDAFSEASDYMLISPDQAAKMHAAMTTPPASAAQPGAVAAAVPEVSAAEQCIMNDCTAPATSHLELCDVHTADFKAWRLANSPAASTTNEG